MEKATFGAGCFWGVEASFRQLKGVHSVVSGYSGGELKNPSYEDVCTGMTGHAEVVQIEFNPEEVSYEKLLEIFWDIHDPTTLNRQGPDIGEQYRSVIFYHTPEQKNAAIHSIEALEKTQKYENSIVTQVMPAQDFYKAEDYHQRYLEKHGLSGCVTHLKKSH